MRISFLLNGEKRAVSCAPLKPLLDLLREDLGITSTQPGCRQGECGACLVLLDSELVNSCLIPAFRLQGRKVTTVEGLGRDRAFQDIRKSLEERGLLPCGFGESGVLMAISYLLSRRAVPTEFEIREALAGNICRCTGSTRLVEAVKNISAKRRPR